MFPHPPDIIQSEPIPSLEEGDRVRSEPHSSVAIGAALLEVGLWISRTNGLPAPAGLHKSMGLLLEYLNVDEKTKHKLEIFGQALLVTRPEIDHVARRVQWLVNCGNLELVVKYVRRVSSSKHWLNANALAPTQSIKVPVTLVKASGVALQGEEIPLEPPVPPMPPVPPRPSVRAKAAVSKAKTKPSKADAAAPPAPSTIQIDYDRLRRLSEQTDEVQRLLALHLDTDADEAATTVEHIVPPVQPAVHEEEPVASAGGSAESDGLVARAVDSLKLKSMWSSTEMADLARQLGVFPGKLIESVNAWSNELYDDDLIYDDEPYEIQLELLSEEA